MGPRSTERWGIEPPKNGKERKGQAKVDGSLVTHSFASLYLTTGTGEPQSFQGLIIYLAFFFFSGGDFFLGFLLPVLNLTGGFF